MNLNDFEFEKVEGGYSLIKYNITEKNEEDVLIPETFQGEPVVEIGERAFDADFMNPTLMKNLTIPNSVTKIGEHAFEDCKKLETVVLPTGLTRIEACTFSQCHSLKECILPEKVEEIGGFTFWDCKKLEQLHLPSSVKKVGDSAFNECTSLRKITCEGDDMKIHKRTFQSCENLEDIPFFLWKQATLPEAQMMKLMEYQVKNWDNLEANEKKDIIAFVKRRKALKVYFFSEGDSTLANFLFREKVGLTLDEVDKCLEHSIAKSKTAVTALLLDYKGKNFDQSQVEAHSEQKELVEIGLERPTPKQFKEKWRCSKVEGGLRVSGYKGEETEETILSELADGTKIVSIGHSKSAGFQPLRKITLEEGIVTLEEKAFCYCSTLEEIILPESLETLGNGAFSLCERLKSITIPKNVKELSRACFYRCRTLEEVVLQEGLLSVADFAFERCDKLGTVHFPDSVIEFQQGTSKEVESGLFLRSGLVSVTIPPKVTKLPNKAFYGCFSLGNVTLHNNITDFGSGTFKFAHALADEKGFVIVGKVLFDYVKKNPFSKDRVKETLCTVPDKVEKISFLAFWGSEMKELILPEGLREIESEAFGRCSDLKKLIIPSFVKVLPKNAIKDCESLVEVVVSSSTTVEEGA
ncbi:MAG: leucine-rich repeat domain-containing protein, partial [Eubacteriales bacterium]